MARRLRTPPPPTGTRRFHPLGGDGGRPSVLVVDDDDGTCEAVKEILEEAGFETVCLSNGKLGLEHLARQTPPAAILLDLMMPVMDGWAFVEHLRASPQLKDIPVIVMTASGPHWGYPVSRVLRKPMGRSELLIAVRDAIAKNQASGGVPFLPARPTAEATQAK